MYLTSTHTNDECRGVYRLEDSRRLITAAVVATLSCRTVVQFAQLYQYLLRDQHCTSSPLHLLSCFQSSSHITVSTKYIVFNQTYSSCISELKTINKWYLYYIFYLLSLHKPFSIQTLKISSALLSSTRSRSNKFNCHKTANFLLTLCYTKNLQYKY